MKMPHATAFSEHEIVCLFTRLDRAEAENTRLRKALRQIASIHEEDTVQYARWVARAALASHPTEEKLGVAVGLVAECSRGRVGLITGQKELPWGLSWVGVGLDDGTEWASRNPRILGDREIGALRGRSHPTEETP